jgi:alpha-galactosidase
VLPRQSQVWAVLRRSDSDERLVYSLAAAFLGRMCLSGDVDRLSESQWGLVKRALQLYRKATPIIKHGISRRFGQIGPSWRHPRGWQGVLRTSLDQGSALAVIHAFEDRPRLGEIPLTGAQWQISDQFHVGNEPARIEENRLIWPIEADFSAAIVLLSRPIPASSRRVAKRVRP